MSINIAAPDLTAKAKLLGMGASLTYDQKINLYRGMLEEAALNMPTDPALLAAEQSVLEMETAVTAALKAFTPAPATTA
jgi:hypothetical protein